MKQRFKFFYKTMHIKSSLIFRLMIFLNIFSIIDCLKVTDLCKSDISTSYGNIENPNSNDTNTVANFCNCITHNSQPFGLPYLEIDCKDRNFNNDNFEGENLPYTTELLDLKFNKFNFIPNFVGFRLKTLNLSNNNLTIIEEENFMKVSNLIRLDLSHNQIEKISLNGFRGLTELQYLDLSKNKITVIQPNIFSPLLELKHLLLSENDLDRTFHQADMDLFINLGVTPKLEILEMNFSNLSEVNIRIGSGLEKVYLRFNNFTVVPDVPRSIELIDLSGNPIPVLEAKFLPHLYKLNVLLLEDMPFLYEIKEYSLFGLPRLSTISLQGSKNLSIFDPYAFGYNVVQNETDTILHTLNLRGCNLETFNSSMKFVLENIKVLEMSGNPILCDCEINWIKELRIETNARCTKPMAMRGKRISEVDSSRLKCSIKNSTMFKVLNGVLIFLLLVLSGVAVYFIVILGIKPLRRRLPLQKLGSSSPYARITTSSITLEPNRAENHF